MRHTTKSIILKIIGILFMLGGAIRLIADRATFQSFLMGHLWSPHPYSIYIYRVLGAFVVFVGISLFVAARDTRKYATLLKAWSIGFILIGIVMLVAGICLRLSVVFFGPDFVFCWIMAIVLYVAARE